MKPSLLPALAILAVASGCMISKPVAPDQAMPTSHVTSTGLTTAAPDRVLVTVVRDTGYFGSSCPFLIFVDTDEAASLMPGQKVDLHLKPGEYILGLRSPLSGICKWGPVVQRDLSVRSGKPLRYRAGYYDSTYILEPSIL